MRSTSDSPFSGRGGSLTSIAALCVALLTAGCGGGGGGTGDAGPGGQPGPGEPPPLTGTAIPVSSFAGRGWYLDAAAGSDDAPGTAAAPWKTLARAARQTLASGDALLLKCGGVWQESLRLGPANAAAGGVTVGIWGTCTTDNRPRVSGSDDVGGLAWTAAGPPFAGKPVHVADWTPGVTALYWNGTPLVRARYPNYGGIGREFKLIEEVRPGRMLVPQADDAPALAALDLSGARITIRTRPWLVEAHQVASSDRAGHMTLEQFQQYTPDSGAGYFVEGKLGLLDTAGEWFHDAAAGKLYVWLPDGSAPVPGALQSVTREVGLSITGVADTSVEHIVFERHARRSVQVSNGPRTRITGVVSRDAGEMGITIDDAAGAGAGGSSVQRSTVLDAAVMGISVNSPAVQIVENQVDGTGIGTSGSGVSAGIHVDSVGGVIRGNQVARSGFAAIVLSRPTGLTVSGNTLTQACRRFTDCGAVYAGGAPRLSQRSSIAANHVDQTAANLEGAVGAAASLVAGIYLDEASAGQDVVGNMINRTSVGINLHNSGNNLVQENDVWLSDHASLRVHSSDSSDLVRGNLIQDNRLYASSHLVSAPGAAAPVMHLVHPQEWVNSGNAAEMFTGADPNIVRRNVSTTMTGPSKVRWSLISGMQQQTVDAAQWGTLAAQESVRAGYAARPFIVTGEGANLIPNDTFRSPGADWTFTPGRPSSSGSVSFGLCGLDCAGFAIGNAGDLLTSSVFPLSATEGSRLYRLRLLAQAQSAGATLTLAVTRASADEAPMGLALTGEPVEAAAETAIEALFSATRSDLARLSITGSVGSTLRLREALLTPVGSYELFEPGRESALLAHAGTGPASIDCPATVLRTCAVEDLAGRAVQWPVTLAPGASLVVLSADAKWR